MRVLIEAIAVIGMFLILIGTHEAGHFLLAKLFHMRVIEFSIGVGPKLWSVTRRGTLYALRPIPILGYVRLGGMEEGEFDQPDGFHNKPAYQRLLVLLAGPFANFLTASLVVTGLGLTQLNDDPGRIAFVDPGSPAAAAGLHDHDSIQSVNGKPMGRPTDLQATERAGRGQELVLVIRHPSGGLETVTVWPASNSSRADAWVIGVHVGVVRPLDALGQGITYPASIASQTVVGIFQLVTGSIPGGATGPDGVHGVVGIGFVTGQAALRGLDYWLSLVAGLSVAVGVANLLPIPALDGGRIVIVLLEKLRGRAFDREREMVVQRVTMAAILMLVVVIAYFDVQRIVGGQFTLFK